MAGIEEAETDVATLTGLRKASLVGLLVICALLLATPADARVPKRFFGIAPQTELTSKDLAWMKKGGVDSIRLDVSWASTEPSPNDFNWSKMNRVVRLAAERRIEVLPFLYRTPSWVAKKPTTLPVDTRRQRKAWKGFVRAVVRRYGKGGRFWRAHPGLPSMPIRAWQIWNEPNFFYFATPASPKRYARLVKLTHGVLKSVDRGAKLILGGLFARPKEGYPRGMAAVKFLRAFYRVRRIRKSFEGVALHPYIANASRLPRTVKPIRRIMRRNGDRRAGIWITEIGWGSQGAGGTAFEKGVKGQVAQLRKAYRFMKSSAGRLNLHRAYWFSWKDALPPACNFCDSVGLFEAGPGFEPKPAWRAFTNFSGGNHTPPPGGDIPNPPPPPPPPDPPDCPPPPLPCI